MFITTLFIVIKSPGTVRLIIKNNYILLKLGVLSSNAQVPCLKVEHSHGCTSLAGMYRHENRSLGFDAFHPKSNFSKKKLIQANKVERDIRTGHPKSFFGSPVSAST